MNSQSYTRGVVYVLLASVFLSTGGLMVRYIVDTNPWTVLFYRSLAFSIMVTIFIWIFERENAGKLYRDMQRQDILIGISLVLGFIFYVHLQGRVL